MGVLEFVKANVSISAFFKLLRSLNLCGLDFHQSQSTLANIRK